MFTGAAVAHDALARAHDDDAHAVEHIGQIADFAIDAATGLARAINLVNHLGAVERVFELHAKLALTAVFDRVELFDVPFILQHLGDAAADLAVGNEHQTPTHTVRIPYPGQHV